MKAAGPSVRDRSSGGPPVRGRGIRSGRSFTGGRGASSGRGKGGGRSGLPRSASSTHQPTKPDDSLDPSASPPRPSPTPVQVKATEDDTNANIYENIDPEDQRLLDLLNSDDDGEDDDEDDEEEVENKDMNPIIKSNRGTEDSYNLRDSNYFDEDGGESGSEDGQEDVFDEEFEEEGVPYDDFDEEEEHRKLLAALEGAIGDSEESEEEDERSSEEVEDPSFIDDDDDVLLGSGIVSPFKKSSSLQESTQGHVSPSTVQSPADKRRDRVRLRVLEEILATERTYYRRLCILVDSFLEPLIKFMDKHKDQTNEKSVPPRTTSNRSNHSDSERSGPQGSVPPRTTSNRSDPEKEREKGGAEGNGSFFSLPDPLIEVSLIEDCFGNVRDLKEFTKLFLDDLEKGYLEQNIGPCFVKHCDEEFLDLYYNYMKVYKEGRLKLERLQSKYWFTVFIAAVELQPQTQNLLLRDFLIEPVQRVPRYKLLLGELIKHTEKGDVLNNLKEAHAQVGKVALDINSRLNKFEQANKMHSLSLAWGFDFKRHGREFLKEGVLTKTDRRGRPSAYHFLLFSDLLVFGSSIGRRGSFKSSVPNSLEKFKLKFRVPLGDCLFIDGSQAVNTQGSRLLVDLPPLGQLAETTKRRRSSVGQAEGMASLAKAAAEVAGSDDDADLATAVAAAELVASAAKHEEINKQVELEAKSWKALVEAGLSMDKLKAMKDAEDGLFVIATPIKTLVLAAPNRQQHNSWLESFKSALVQLENESMRESSLEDQVDGRIRSASSTALPRGMGGMEYGDSMRPPSPRARRRSIGGLFGGVSHHQSASLEGKEVKEDVPRPVMSRRRSFFGGKLSVSVLSGKDSDKASNTPVEL